MTTAETLTTEALTNETGPDLDPSLLSELRALVAEVMEVAPDQLAPADDLFLHGLDSIRLMRVAARLARWDADVDLADLAESATLDSWARLIGAQVGPQ